MRRTAWNSVCRMSTPDEEIAALRSQVAALSERLVLLEQRIGEGVREKVPPVLTTPRPERPPLPPSPETTSQPDVPRVSPLDTVLGTSSSIDSVGLETKIGQHWLN